MELELQSVTVNMDKEGGLRAIRTVNLKKPPRNIFFIINK